MEPEKGAGGAGDGGAGEALPPSERVLEAAEAAGVEVEEEEWGEGGGEEAVHAVGRLPSPRRRRRRHTHPGNVLFPSFLFSDVGIGK